ncbi:SCO family protein [Fulvivirgaceae bacterium BMA12]|uniref:SCO family protein n=1 Tax=Agaribacillus aureus TaxID=3051825 RepID=A0ABT8L6T7_9BACT|nr:SCO family protein [Fulvivirgaceae bacterium BMA12]
MKRYNLIFLAIISLSILVSCDLKEESKSLPILGHMNLVDRVKDGKKVIDTVYHTIPDFSFIDQDSNSVTHRTFDDKIYVADFFFTSCPDICPAMTTQMLRVYEKFRDNPGFALLSHTIDPKRDSVTVLKDYSERIGVEESGKWFFVTGQKEDIYDIGLNGYMVTADESPDAPGGYIHSGAFILVDKERRIRGVYDGTKEEKVDLLMEDIPKLMAEYQKP